ncbi:hypothetical protein E4U58_001638 [Claviceps cyperi]|nr:hypothetical protein E4U58_001638 [Claviceps cyperi]
MVLPHRAWNFNIDRHLNPFVPSPPWKFVPYPLAWFLGYRKTKPHETGNLMPIFWAFIGVFAAILLIEGVSKHIPSFTSHGAPMIVGSFGAAAVLEFYSIEAPLAQPRNAICGQVISAFTGIAMAKLFQLSDRFTDIQWVGGALACASATALMALTKTVHPPAGATALLAVVDVNLVRIGWFLLPVMLLGCALMLVVALLVNNIERRFPIYWWTPEECRRSFPMLTRRSSDELRKTASMLDEEKGASNPDLYTAGAEADAKSQSRSLSHEGVGGSSDEATVGAGRTTNFTRSHLHLDEIVIRRGQVIVPQHMFLTQEEEQLFETMSYRL